jgi:hypothetical protein
MNKLRKHAGKAFEPAKFYNSARLELKVVCGRHGSSGQYFSEPPIKELGSRTSN